MVHRPNISSKSRFRPLGVDDVVGGGVDVAIDVDGVAMDSVVAVVVVVATVAVTAAGSCSSWSGSVFVLFSSSTAITSSKSWMSVP